MVLQVMRKRESEMDGKMPCMRGMEYDGGGDRGDRKEGLGRGIGYARFGPETDAPFSYRLVG